MAATPPASDQLSKVPASAMAQSLSLPSVSTNTSLKGSIDSPKPSTATPKNASLSGPPKSLKRPSSPSFDLPPPLTGAAAMADNARQRDLDEQRQAQMTSVNPATATKNALLGAAGLGSSISTSGSTPAAAETTPAAISTAAAMSSSRSNPRPITGAASEQSSTPSILRNPSTTTSEPLTIEPPQTSPISMSGSDGANSANVFAVNNGSVDSSKTNTSAEMSHDEKKALTYPPQIMPGDLGANSPSTPVRGMSVPGTSKSPVNKRHKCPHCSTEFTRHHNLKSHLLTHSQEKPYGCQQCSSRFRRLHDLKRHIKLHTGERPHICGKCGRKFARGDALARHSKGPGGCAGRRGSMGGDGDYDDSVLDADMSMEGVEYTGGGDNDDAETSPGGFSRRKSEPNRMRKQSLQRTANLQSSPGPSAPGSATSSHGPYRQHSSTYPGGLVAPQAPAMGRGSPSRNLYPPGGYADPSLSSSASTVASNSNRHLSPKSALERGSGIFNPHAPTSGIAAAGNNNSANLFSHANANLTESPKSLSPGGPAHRQLPSSSSSQPAPPASSTAAPGLNLPPLAGLTGQSSATRQPSTSSPSSAYPSATSTLPPSGISGGGDMWDYVRSMERRLTEEMHQRLQTQEQHYETKISRLQDELSSLRGGKEKQPSFAGTSEALSNAPAPSAVAAAATTPAPAPTAATPVPATTSTSREAPAPTASTATTAPESAPTLPPPSGQTGPAAASWSTSTSGR